MKPHLTSSPATRHLDNQDRTAQVLALPVGIGDRAGLAQTVSARRRLTLASTPVWRHKLILTGSLDHRTAAELEDEIECLCEEGVTALTLDLRQLDAIDSVGVRSIALRGAVCKRRGCDLTAVPGSPAVHRALAEAGAESLLVDDLHETDLRLVTTPSDTSHDTSTATIKNL